MANRSIYTPGGTVQAGKGIYLSRAADEQLLQLCRDGAFAYVLTSRQMGKSSLMIQTARQLAAEGILPIIVDLTDVGVQDATAETWYRGFLLEIENKLEQQGQLLETDVYEWWQTHNHLTSTQRFTRFFRTVLLQEIERPIVVFVDEIDTTLSLDFTDDFFIGIRTCYTARAQDPVFERLSFVLIGVATPGDLIIDARRTPFNIGQRVDLTDFTLAEALPLQDGLGLADTEGRAVLQKVWDWTEGHPYLTQRLCIELARHDNRDWGEADVDALVRRTFLEDKREQDNNLQFVRDMLISPKRSPDVLAGLSTYREIYRGKRPVLDEEQSLIKSHLKLAGVVKPEGNHLRVRNAIYQTVFDRRWIRDHWPQSWWQRVKPALPLVAASIAVALAMTGLAGYAFRQTRRVEAALAREEEQRRQLEIALTDRNAALAGEAEQRKLAEERLQAAQIARQQAEDAQTAEQAQRQFADQQRGVAESARQAETVQRQLAETQGQVALARQLAAQSEWLRRQRLALLPESILLAVESMKRLQGASEATADANQALHGLKLLTPEKARIAHEGKVTAVRFSPDGQYVATGSRDKTARVWDIAANREMARIVHEGAVTDVQFSPDGQYVATSSGDKTARVWNIAANREVTRIAHEGNVNAVRFSPDGQYVATRSSDHTARVWDIAANREVAQIAHEGEVVAMRFSPDGQYVVSGSSDNTARVWDIKANREVARIAHEGEVVAVRFSPDGR